MYNLRKTFKAAVVFLPIVFFTLLPSFVYSFDYTDVNLTTVTNSLDSLDYNYKGFDIKFKSFAVGETFDDNILYTKNDKKEDLITNINLGVGIKYEGKMNTFELIGNLYNEIYAKNDEFNSTSEDVGLNFKSELSKNDRISLNDVFLHTYLPLFFKDQFISDQFGRPQDRFSQYKNLFHTEYTHDLTRQLSTSIKYDNELNLFPSDTVSVDPSLNNNILSDSFLNKATSETSYLLSSSTTISFLYSFLYEQFAERRITENGKDASIQTIAPGIKQYITKKMYFIVRPGIDFIDSYDGGDLVKPNIQSSLTYEMDVNTRFLLLYEKRYDTNSYVNDIFNQWRTSLSFTHQLSERFGFSQMLFYGKGEFISSDTSRQQLLGSKSSFTYDINKNVKGELAYSHAESDGEIGTAGYSKNTVFIGLTAAF